MVFAVAAMAVAVRDSQVRNPANQDRNQLLELLMPGHARAANSGKRTSAAISAVHQRTMPLKLVPGQELDSDFSGLHVSWTSALIRFVNNSAINTPLVASLQC